MRFSHIISSLQKFGGIIKKMDTLEYCNKWKNIKIKSNKILGLWDILFLS